MNDIDQIVLTNEELRALQSCGAGMPVASSLQHALGKKGLLVFAVTPRARWIPTETGKVIIAREKQRAADALEAAITAARAAVKRTPEPQVKYVSRIQTGLMKEEITLEKMDNGVIRIYFPHKPIWRIRRALEKAMFTFYEKGDFWAKQDDGRAQKFIQDYLSHDIYVEDEPEAQPVETPAPEQTIDSALAYAYLVREYDYENRELNAAKDEMRHEARMRKEAIAGRFQRWLTILEMREGKAAAR